MRRIERRAEIAAPPQELFAFLADISNLAEWQSGVVAVEAPPDRPLAVGDRIVVTREALGQRVRAELTVAELEPPHLGVLAGKVGGVEIETSFAVEPDAAGSSRLQLTITLRSGGLAAFMEPMLASTVERDLEDSIERLQARFAPD